MNIVGNHSVLVEVVHRFGEGVFRSLVQVGHGDPSGQQAEVGVVDGHVRRRLRREFIELGRRDAGIDSLDNLLGDGNVVDEVGVEAVAKLLDARRDLVEQNLLGTPIPLRDEHRFHGELKL